MRKVLITGVCTLLLAASAESARAQTVPKFAIINMQQLFSVAPGRAEAAATHKKEADAAQEQFKAMSDTMQKLTEAFNKEEAALAALPRAERLKMLRDKQTSFEERAEKMRQALNEREADLTAPITELLQKAIEDFRAENGYTIIFDVSSGAGIVALDKNLDVTERLVARVSKMPAPKVVAPTKAPAGPTVAPAGVKRPPSE